MTTANAQPTGAAPASGKSRRDPLLFAIGIFKLLKAVMLYLVALGARHLIHRSVYDFALHVCQRIRFDPGNHHIHALLQRTLSVSDKQLRELEIGTLVYGTLFLIEATGLLLQKHWAEWMTVITTGLLVPLEVYELFHHFTPVKLVIFAINVLIVVYLIVKLMRDPKRAGA